MSRYARKKGHDFERKIAADFRELGYEDAKTTRSARGGDWSKTDNGVDLVDTGRFAVQCKRTANYVSVNTIEEIYKNVKGWGIALPDLKTAIPLLLTKANNKPVMAVIPWEDLKTLIRL